MKDWNAQQYLRFEAQRSRPARDLALRVKEVLGDRAMVCPDILDLGCGPGNSTAVLADVFPSAGLTGLDSSPDMIAAARATGLAARWLVADAATWEADRPLDLVFSNAMLQWIPDQEDLVRRMWSWLAPGGALALQVPGNASSPLHLALLHEAAAPRWKGCFEGLEGVIHYREPLFWHEVLESLGTGGDVWESTYWHVLPGPHALIDWYASTGMRPWLARLDEAQQDEFKRGVLEKARPLYASRGDGTVIFPFRRIFCTGRKAAG